MDPRLMSVATRAVNSYLEIRQDEQVVIIIDKATSPEIPEALQAAIIAAGAEPIVISVVPRHTSGEELPGAVLDAVVRADVVISACSRSPYHTSLKVVAREAETRGTLNAPANVDGWLHGAMQFDFAELRKPASVLRDILTEGSSARVTSPNGTDLAMSIAGREAVGWLSGMAQNPCDLVAWPGGEVSLPPIEGTTIGKVVVEVAMTDVGALAAPIEWTVEKGLVREILGGAEAEALRRIVDGVENAHNIGELGIGISPAARLVGDITEAKKRSGTAHIAMGDSANGYGGKVECALHLDGLVPDVTIEIDGQAIVKDGVLLFG